MPGRLQTGHQAANAQHTEHASQEPERLNPSWGFERSHAPHIGTRNVRCQSCASLRN